MKGFSAIEILIVVIIILIVAAISLPLIDQFFSSDGTTIHVKITHKEYIPASMTMIPTTQTLPWGHTTTTFVQQHNPEQFWIFFMASGIYSKCQVDSSVFSRESTGNIIIVKMRKGFISGYPYFEYIGHAEEN